ncbi:nucleoside hydrolase [Novosphingobium endophyticum]|uniref:nucleoside hydrolase n=1 Tax=Novosphingobium endophyticum TaxID=1955250 RepID=UPI0016667B1D|nr:nucleoside hydrolase [Novosphingobium endophyticum]
MTVSRRTILGGALAAASGALAGAGAGQVKAQPNPTPKPPARHGGSKRPPFTPAEGARARVLIANEFSGDIDALFSAVHALLSRSTEVRGIIGCRARFVPGYPERTAERSVELVDEILRLMNLTGAVPSLLGSAQMSSSTAPSKSPGAQAIVDEAMRTDTVLPLYVAVGGGLTEVASALLIEPRVADRFTLVWIGGHADPKRPAENNFVIDPLAAQLVFNQFNVPIWQVPSDVYRTCMVSSTELQAFIAPYGAIGTWLYDKLLEDPRKHIPDQVSFGETYRMGDSPLVLLTALTDLLPVSANPSASDQRTSSSRYEESFAPYLNPDGTYTPRDSGRKIRVYKSVDTRLMFSDFFAKMRVNYDGCEQPN